MRKTGQAKSHKIGLNLYRSEAMKGLCASKMIWGEQKKKNAENQRAENSFAFFAVHILRKFSWLLGGMSEYVHEWRNCLFMWEDNQIGCCQPGEDCGVVFSRCNFRILLEEGLTRSNLNCAFCETYDVSWTFLDSTCKKKTMKKYKGWDFKHYSKNCTSVCKKL